MINMKIVKYKGIAFLLLAVLMLSCKDNQIELYDQSPRINFISNTVIEFTDVEYANDLFDKEVGVKVRLQGDFLRKDLNFCLRSEKNDNANFAKITFAEKYTFVASTDKVESEAIVSVKRPSEFTSQQVLYNAQLLFDNDNPLHQFDRGLEEWSERNLIVRYEISRPKEWSYSDRTWGPYSIGKYLFIMDTLKQIYDDFSADDVIEDNKIKVVVAYDKYLETNDPILDENGNEIYFP